MLEDIVNDIKNRKATRVLIQVPEGLKTKAAEIMVVLEKAGIDAVLSADACYGACDIADGEAAALKCDLILHIGHSKFYRDFETAVPVLYYPWEIDVELKNIDFSIIKESRIGIVATIQHLKMLGRVKEMLERAGKRATIGGQILGCWAANAENLDADALLFVGSGHFHPAGLKGSVYALNLERMRIEKIDATGFEKRRFANIYNAMNARCFAILVSSKQGQMGPAEAGKIKEKLLQKDKKAFIVIMDEISDAKLAGIKVDAFINTACPRLADDNFSKPFVNASDINLVLEE